MSALRAYERDPSLRERPIAILPGQYFDAETGLHQNHHRDMDPGTGRYLQSDPIGLAGGLSTYGYANQNPLKYTDPNGLNAAVAGCLAGPAGCAAGIVVTGVAAWMSTPGGRDAMKKVADAIGDACSDDDDDIGCEEWLGLLNDNYARLTFIESKGGNVEAEKQEHNQSVQTFCSSCPAECSRALTFGVRRIH